MFYPRFKRYVSTQQRLTKLNHIFSKLALCSYSIFRHPVHLLVFVSCVVVLINEFFIYTLFRWTWPSLKCNSGKLKIDSWFELVQLCSILFCSVRHR